MCYPERRGLVSLCGVKAACSGDLCAGNGHRGKNWSLDILSRAFFNRAELTSRISRFAPDQLTQATGEPKLPSLAKEGWTRHQVNGPVPLTARTGWFVQLPIIGGLNEPPRLRPLRRLRRFFLMGAATPHLPRRGVFAPKKPRKCPNSSPLLCKGAADLVMASDNCSSVSIRPSQRATLMLFSRCGRLPLPGYCVGRGIGFLKAGSYFVSRTFPSFMTI